MIVVQKRKSFDPKAWKSVVPDQQWLTHHIEVEVKVGVEAKVGVETEEEITRRNIVAGSFRDLHGHLSANIQVARLVYRRMGNVRSAVPNPVMFARLSALVGVVFKKQLRVTLPGADKGRNEASCENVTMLASNDVPLGNAAKQCASILTR